jgi:hypothetical protein
MSFFDVEVLK